VPYLRIPVEPHQARHIRDQIATDKAAGLVLNVREIQDGDTVAVYVDYTPQPLSMPGTIPINRTPLPVCYVFKQEPTK
jgi:hypothetical protein